MRKTEERSRAILLVEDNEMIAAGCKHLLERLGWYVHHFDRPRDAVDAVREGILYDIALVDSEFGDMGGDHIIGDLKAVHPNIPTGTFSAYDYPAIGADFHLQKGSNGFTEKLTRLLEKTARNISATTYSPQKDMSYATFTKLAVSGADHAKEVLASYCAQHKVKDTPLFIQIAVKSGHESSMGILTEHFDQIPASKCDVCKQISNDTAEHVKSVWATDTDSPLKISCYRSSTPDCSVVKACPETIAQEFHAFLQSISFGGQPVVVC